MSVKSYIPRLFGALNSGAFYTLIILSLKIGIVLISFSVISGISFGVNILSSLNIFFVEAVLTFLGGFFIVLCARPKIATNVEWFGFSYLAGIFLTVFLYFPVITFHLDEMPYVFEAVVFGIEIAGIALILSRNGDKYVCIRDKRGENICLFFVVVCLILYYFIMSWNNLTLNTMDVTSIVHDDFSYWIGNTIELTKEFPPKNFRYYPQPYGYHYLSSIEVAYLSLLTGVPSLILSCDYYYVQPIILMVFGAYCLFQKCMPKKFIPAMMVCMLFSTGVERITAVWISMHRYVIPFGSDYGFGILLWCLLLAIHYYESSTSNIRLSVGLIVCIVFLIGFKIPYGVIASYIFLVLVIDKICKKNYVELYAFIFGACFFSVALIFLDAASYLSALGMDAQTTLSQYIYLTMQHPHSAVVQYGEIGKIHNAFRSANLSFFIHVFGEIVFLILYFFLMSPVAALLFGIGLFLLIARRRMNVMSGALLSSVLACFLIVTYVYNKKGPGMSMMYFGEIGMPLCIVFFAYCSDAFAEIPNKIFHKGKMATIFFICMSLLSACFFLHGGITNRWRHGGRRVYFSQWMMIKNGLYNFLKANDLSAAKVIEYESYSNRAHLSVDEIKCYLFLNSHFRAKFKNTTGEKINEWDGYTFRFGNSKRQTNVSRNLMGGVISEAYFLNDVDLLKESEYIYRLWLKPFLSVFRMNNITNVYFLNDDDLQKDSDTIFRKYLQPFLYNIQEKKTKSVVPGFYMLNDYNLLKEREVRFCENLRPFLFKLQESNVKYVILDKDICERYIEYYHDALMLFSHGRTAVMQIKI